MNAEEEKMSKFRKRMERDAYSVLVSFKDGATPKQLETRMDETLGYTYHGKYQQGGVSDMAQLLREHEKVRPFIEGRFKIVVTEEVSDLVALIAKQKDNKRKKKGGAPKTNRPLTSVGFHRNPFSGGLGVRTSPKNNPRTFSSMGRPKMQKINNVPPNGMRSASSASFVRPSVSASSFGSYHARPIPPPYNPNFKQPRPLRYPVVIPPSDRPQSVKPETRHCQMPSIKEFAENAQKMMMKRHPNSVHLSELTDLYSQEYGVSVDPLQLFSKSWKMLVSTTFKDWLVVVNSDVKLREDWALKNILMAAISQKMRGLTMGARKSLRTPEKPPGLNLKTEVASPPPPESYNRSTTTRPATEVGSNYYRNASSSSSPQPSPATLSPPIIQSTRMPRSYFPAGRLLGQALAAVKRQSDHTDSGRLADHSTAPPVSISSNVTNNEPAEPKACGSVAGRRALLLPPMSKGAGVKPLHRHLSTQSPESVFRVPTSSTVSRTSSNLLDDAMRTDLPESDVEYW